MDSEWNLQIFTNQLKILARQWISNISDVVRDMPMKGDVTDT